MDPAFEKLKVKVDPKIDEIPVYIPAGSIIPLQPVVQSTAFVSQGPLELRVYPGDNCSGELYLDDGHTFGYKIGKQFRLSMTCNAEANSEMLTISPTGSYKPWFSDLEVVFNTEFQRSRNLHPKMAGR